MSPPRPRPVLLRLIWWLGGCAILLGLARDPLFQLLPAPRELPRFDGRSGIAWVEGGFTPQLITPGLLPRQVQHVSSWVGSDDWQGRSASAWFKANRRTIHVGIAGHPLHPHCALWAEFRLGDDRIERVDCRRPNPNTEWNVWEIATPAGAVAVRIVGEDRATGADGWIAFSHPFRAPPGWIAAVYQFLQIATTLALALTVVWGPGLLLLPRVAPELRLVVLLGTGPGLLLGLGLAVWLLAAYVPAGWVATAGITALWLGLGLRGRRQPPADAATAELHLPLALAALLAATAVARASSSLGPAGELFRGTISRNLELSDRIDSRFSFYAVQLAAHGIAPQAPEAAAFYRPWTYFSRGPLAGLVATPLVLSTHAAVPREFPDFRWSPFDRHGFAAYRIALIVLASMLVVAVARGLAPLLGPHYALLAAGLLALSPFGGHETLFTWPKFPATAWTVAAFALAHQHRPLAAGLALGVGFLFHPLALLWAPWIGLWAAARAWRRRPDHRLRPAATALAVCGAGALLLFAPWMLLGAALPPPPDAPLAGQGGFLRYWIMADWHYATWETWLRTRWMNFANTFIPLHLVLDPASFGHPKLGSAYEPSPAFVRFSQVWWNTLPFALGLGLWLAALAAFVRACRDHLAVAVLLVVLPSAFVVAYWGMDPLGLMRECGHPLLVTLIALTCFVAARTGGPLAALLQHRATPWLQLPETLLMFWLTSLANPRPSSVTHAHLDALYLALTVCLLATMAHLLARARAAGS